MDTNVVVSTWVYSGALAALETLLVERRFQLVANHDLWHEYIKVLHYEKFYLSEEKIQSILEDTLRPATEFVEAFPGILANPCRDQDDDLLLRIALGGDANILVTGDKELLDLQGKYPFIIQRPADFLKSMH